MMDALQDYLKDKPIHQRLNGTREYLQRLILQSLDQGGKRKALAFTGGTALHIVYGTRRFSEDLDFSLLSPKDYSTSAVSQSLMRQMRQFGFHPEIHSLKDEKTVASFYLRFSKLLFPLKITANETQKLTIKIEVDKRPPAGGLVEETLIHDPVLFLTTHYGLPSLFATKLHAILFRKFTKGRDFFDLLFYLGRRIRPNFQLFQNAVQQTHPGLDFPDLASLREALDQRIAAVDDQELARDVEPFLLNPDESRYLKKDLLLKALDQNAELFSGPAARGSS